MGIAELVAQGYGGYKGWTDEASAAADFANTGGSGKWTGAGLNGPGSSSNSSQVPSSEKFVQGQIATEEPVFQTLMQRMGEREAPLDIYSRLETAQGLPELRSAAKSLSGEVNSLEDILRQIEPDVAGTTRESLVTESQRRGIVQAKSEPYLEKLDTISTALGRISNNITTAESNIATKVQLAMEGQDNALEPLQLYYSVLVDRNARLLTGFNADRETQLDMLWDKLKRDRQLSDAEWERANSLSSEELDYKRSLQKAAASAGIKLGGGESIDELLGLIGAKVGANKYTGLTADDFSLGDEVWGQL